MRSLSLSHAFTRPLYRCRTNNLSQRQLSIQRKYQRPSLRFETNLRKFLTSTYRLGLHNVQLELQDIILSSPLSTLPITYFDQYDFHLLTESNIGKCCDHLINCFNKPLLNEQQLQKYQNNLLAMSLYRIYDKISKFDQYIGYYIGFLYRGGDRLKIPSLDLSVDSLIIVVTAKGKSSALTNAPVMITDNKEIVAIIEVCLEEPNGILTPPIQLFKPVMKASYMPYICNLSVSESYRRKGIGRMLCEIAESIAVVKWNKSNIYLHVEASNMFASAMYLNMGYNIIQKLTDFETKMHSMQNIQYYTKKLN